MNNLNLVPPIIQQKIEAVKDKSTPENIRFNHIKSLENIRDICDGVIRQYYGKGKTK